MVQHLSPRDFDKEPRQPQLILVTSNPSGAPLDPAPDEPEDTVGGTLRRARLARGGKSLEDIARELCIRPHLLEALENDHFEQLPGLIYASGFLRTYATALGLDPAPLVARLKGASPQPAHDAPLVFPEPINDPRIPRRPLVALAAILCLAVYGAWYSFSGSSDNLEKTTPAPGRDMTALAPAGPVAGPPPAQAPAADGLASDGLASDGLGGADAPQVAALTAPAAPAPAVPAPAVSAMNAPPATALPGRILLRADSDSWIRVTDAGNRIIAERTLKAGETYSVAGDAGYRLLAGNAGGLTVEAAGKRYGPLGAPGDVRRNFALDPATFAASLPAAR